MRKFAITATSFTGEITYTYNTAGFLVGFAIEAELNDVQYRWILANLPLSVDEMTDRFMKSNKITVSEVLAVVTFEMFWNSYDDKIRSSKKKSLAKWDKLTQSDQAKSYLFINKYNRNRGNADKKYAETYLNAELWNN